MNCELYKNELVMVPTSGNWPVVEIRSIHTYLKAMGRECMYREILKTGKKPATKNLAVS